MKKALTEEKFYMIMDYIEENIGLDLTEGYYPTIEELEVSEVTKDLDTFLPIIMYFAHDPFKAQDNAQKDLKDYKATVKFCKDIISKIDF